MKPNVLFLLLDGVRSDKFFGEKKSSLTPNLDLLLKKGTYFSQAVASAPSTVPAVSSIMTSLYPHKAMIKDNNLYRINLTKKNFPTLFKKYGYNTYCTFQEAIEFLGLDQIFDDSDNYSNHSFLWNGLSDKIFEQFEKNLLKEPWLYYLHLYDLHILSFTKEERKKFAPTEFNNKKFGINQYEQFISAIDRCLGKILEKIDLKRTIIVTTSDHGIEYGVYDDELQKINDKNIELRKHKQGSLFKISHKAALTLPPALLPIRKKLSAFYNDKTQKNTRKKMKHVVDDVEKQDISPYKKRIMKQSALFSGDVEPLLYDDRFRIPILFTGWNFPQGKIIQDQVRSIDIFPTLADIIGIEFDKDIHGRSLLTSIHKKEHDLPAFLEGAVNAPKFVSKEWVGIRIPEFKYFRSKNISNDKPHLYDLINDPNEEYNIANKNKSQVDKMEKILSNILQGKNFKHDEIHESSDDESLKVESELRKLGYM